MNELIAFCGLDCATCEAYRVTQAEDEPGKLALLEKWRVEYQSPEMEISAVTCDGCHATVRLGGYSSQCGVRACAIACGYQTCADCPDYACETLEAILSMAPQARSNLDSIRALGRS
jgi:hypothetical protein